ncbi:MAG: hypothetical protein R2851_07595 [Caldilineaceae bacterium]
MLDLDSGEIIYVIAQYGGILDIGATSLTMPLDAFRWSGDRLMLNFDEPAPGFPRRGGPRR